MRHPALLAAVAGAAALAALAATLEAPTFVSEDVLEPSVRNEVDHALARAPAHPPPCRVPLPAALTNAPDATALAVRLVSAQRADGRWMAGTNDVTASVVAILEGL